MSFKRVSGIWYLVSGGQSMIEVVVGLGIATLLSVALISTTVYTQKLSRSAKNRTQATKLVQQAVEQLRGFRDSTNATRGFANLASAGAGCYYDTNAGTDINTAQIIWVFSGLVVPCGVPPPVPGTTEQITPASPATSDLTFSRWVQFTSITANEKAFTVYVSWQGGSGLEYVSNSSSLSNPCTGAASAC
jgi:type II secretory pathway pseudopilin PulG